MAFQYTLTRPITTPDIVTQRITFATMANYIALQSLTIHHVALEHNTHMTRHIRSHHDASRRSHITLHHCSAHAIASHSITVPSPTGPRPTNAVKQPLNLSRRPGPQASRTTQHTPCKGSGRRGGAPCSSVVAGLPASRPFQKSLCFSLVILLWCLSTVLLDFCRCVVVCFLW